MSDQPSPGDLQQKYRQFLDLTPLATALAGLPVSGGARNFTEEQIDGRSMTMRSAFKVARNLVEELTGGDAQKVQQLRDLLPLTIALAGLPASEGRLYSEDQVEGRGITFRAAYRIARATARDYLGGS